MFILKCWVVFPLYTRSHPNQAVLVNNCFKPGARMLGFKEAEEYFMMIEDFSSCEDINTLNRFPLNGDITFQTTFLLEIRAKNMEKKRLSILSLLFFSSRKIQKTIKTGKLLQAKQNNA